MQSGISDKGKPGAISRLENTDYELAWLAFIGQIDRDYLIETVGKPENIGDVVIKIAQAAFDIAWDARGLADLAIIHAHRND